MASRASLRTPLFRVASFFEPGVALIACPPFLGLNPALEAFDVLSRALGAVDAKLPFIADLLKFEDGNK
jgi:hypothetical protein